LNGANPVIMIVPLNFDPPPLGLSGVPHATHCVAAAVLGFPQFEQKTVTSRLRGMLSIPSAPRFFSRNHARERCGGPS
jgi:hypothetical protein